MDNKTAHKIIAVDFDGCLVVNKWPEVGAPIEKNINKLKAEQADVAKVIDFSTPSMAALTEVFNNIGKKLIGGNDNA